MKERDRDRDRRRERDSRDRDRRRDSSRGYDRTRRHGGRRSDGSERRRRWRDDSGRGGRDNRHRRGVDSRRSRNRRKSRGGGGKRKERRSRSSRRWEKKGRRRKEDEYGDHLDKFAPIGKRARWSPAAQWYNAAPDAGDRASESDSSDDSKKRKGSDESNEDEIVHFEWQKGAVLNSRYEVVKLLGDGTFGRVVLAKDRSGNGREMAIKVIRDVKRYIENARIEADILKDIRKDDRDGTKSRSAIMYDTFMHARHFCLVFEAHGSSLYDFVKENDFRGFWMMDIQSFAQQSLEALAFLHGKLKLTHTDLKPENILLESVEPPRPSRFPREENWLERKRRSRSSSRERGNSQYLRPVSSRIRLIDFGNATYEDEHHSSIINTRQYRGPEVVLSLGWNERSDIWSLGCILMELYTGELLFGTHENAEHLALMERVLAPLPPKMLAEASKAVRSEFLTYAHHASEWRLNWPAIASTSSSERHVQEQGKLSDLLATSEHRSFADFVGHLLTADPAIRPSAEAALQHSFFSKTFSD
eukprot:TRINITY_DN73546_c0_g1_i1.p1 TRINITY_DN73546_c0_g1~~TRINITY_DN73546_c0_g1_i1.p1  ORF type:complete len:531 (+),score=95.62 TRINITY_DN73546_c0_g1_i1:115-1707(+)